MSAGNSGHKVYIYIYDEIYSLTMDDILDDDIHNTRLLYCIFSDLLENSFLLCLKKPIREMQILKLINTFSVFIFLNSCAVNVPISFLCNEQNVEIYINGDYVGRGQINYTVPKGTDYIKVSCRENGIEIYSRTYYIKGKKNQLFEITVPRDYRYSLENR